MCTPPETHLYGAINNIDIIVSFNIPKKYAIPNIMKIFGTSPIIFCKPYIITSALSSFISGISFLILLVRYVHNLSITILTSPLS